MYKNYFILNRIVTELNAVVKGFTVTEIFSQQKDQLILKCENESVKFLEISVNPVEPYITLRNEYHRARKNSISFFEEHLPARIDKFEISDHDRLVKTACEKVSFYFAVRGKYTNLFIEDIDGNISSFKRTDESYLNGFKSEIPAHKFITGKGKPEFESPDLDLDEYRRRHPFIGREIINEAAFRLSGKKDRTNAGYLNVIIEELMNEDPAVFLSEQSNEIHLAVKGFHIFPADEIKIFDTVLEALNYFLGKKYYLEAVAHKRKKIEKHIERDLSKLSSKMNDLKGRIDRGSREKEYNKTGNLLLINLNSIPSKSSSVELEDIYRNNRIIKIKLDPKLSPQKNAEYYFSKAGNEKIAYQKSMELFRDISDNHRKLLLIRERFNKSQTLEELDRIMKELKIKPDDKRVPADDIKSKFKHYIIEKKYDVFVGKDSAGNDLLTMKFAKQNDYWFHARSVPGSHVVLKVTNTKEPVPKNVLKSAASIAAFHSKSKTSGLAPVSYTFKKYVTKRKGMEPGKVALLKEDVLLVKPEIPTNCEYISNE